MDQTKVRVVAEWPTPTTIEEMQRFLGFAHFYRCFIRNYSSLVSPITTLLNDISNKLTWTEPTQAAFDTLKNSFTTAPTVKHPDPKLPFIVESDSGIGAVLL